MFYDILSISYKIVSPSPKNLAPTMAQKHAVDVNKNAEHLIRVIAAQFVTIVSESKNVKKTLDSQISKLNDKTEAQKLLNYGECCMEMLNNKIEECEKVAMGALRGLCESIPKDNSPTASPPKSMINSTIISDEDNGNTNDERALSMASTMDFLSDDEDDDIQPIQLKYLCISYVSMQTYNHQYK